MNHIDAIEYLGAKEGKCLKIFRDVEDLNQDLPYFSIEKNGDCIYKLRGYNYEHHDNADRMHFILNYFSTMILKYISNDVDLTGFYNIELHDSNSYLDQSKQYKNCLVWCKNKSDNDVVLLPDLYHMTGYGGKLNTGPDQTKWHAKRNDVAFFGTTTGDTNPALNARLQYCEKALTSPLKEVCDFHITNVAQMKEADIVNYYGQEKWNIMKHQWVPHTYLYNYKFNLDIPGNTASWDRVPVVLNSKSLLFKSYCHDMCFYYPLLQENVHYVSTPDAKSIIDKRTFFLSNDNQHQLIIDNANKFARDVLTPNTALRYAISLFTTAFNYNGK